MAIKTEKQFRKHLKEVAQDTVSDGFDLDDAAYDLAEAQMYDPDVRAYMARNHPEIKTRLQWKEFLGDLIIL